MLVATVRTCGKGGVEVSVYTDTAFSGFKVNDLISIVVGNTIRYARYQKSSEDKKGHIFTYVIANDDSDTGGITIGGFVLNENILNQIASGSIDATIRATAKVANKIIVDNSSPQITKTVITGVASDGKVKNILTQGDSIKFQLTANEKLLSGSSSNALILKVGNEEKTATFVSYAKNSQDKTMVFDYKIQTTDNWNNKDIFLVNINPTVSDSSKNTLLNVLPKASSGNPFTVDNTAPKLLSQTQGTIAIKESISLVFDSALKLNAGKITLKAKNGSDIVIDTQVDKKQISLSGDKKTLVLKPASLVANATYNVMIDNKALTDIAGNAYAGFNLSDTKINSIIVKGTSPTTSIKLGGVLSDGYLNKDEITQTNAPLISGVLSNQVSLTSVALRVLDENGVLSQTAISLSSINIKGRTWQINALPNGITQGKYQVEAVLNEADKIISEKIITVDTTAPVLDANSTKIILLNKNDVIKSSNLKVGDKFIISFTSNETLKNWVASDKIQVTISNDLGVKKQIYASYLKSTGIQHYFQYTVKNTDNGTLTIDGLLASPTDIAGNTLTNGKKVLFNLPASADALPVIDNKPPVFSLGKINKKDGGTTLGESDILQVTLVSQEAILGLNNQDKLAIKIGANQRIATYVGQGADNKSFVFEYTVKSFDKAIVGVGLGKLFISKNVTDVAGNFAQVTLDKMTAIQQSALKSIKIIDQQMPVLIDKTEYLSLGTDVLTLQFNESLKIGSGKITIQELGTFTPIETIQVNKNNVVLSQDGKQIFIKHKTVLDLTKAYLVSFGEQVISDLAAPSNKFVGFNTVNARWEIYNAKTSVEWGAVDGSKVSADGYLNANELSKTEISGVLSGTKNGVSITSIIFKDLSNGNDVIVSGTLLPTTTQNYQWTLKNHVAWTSLLVNNRNYKIEVSLSNGATESVRAVGKSKSEVIKVDIESPPISNLVLLEDTGINQTDGISSVNQINVSNLESGAIWQYQVDGGSWVAGGTAGSVGVASFNMTQADGRLHTYVVQQIDKAGNKSDSVSLTAMLDVILPQSPALTLASDSGISNSDKITNQPQINVSNLESGAIWQYQVDGGSWMAGGTAGSVGVASFNMTQADGQWHTYFVRQTDMAENVSYSLGETFMLDQTSPSITLKLARDTGFSDSDNISIDSIINIDGLSLDTEGRRFYKIDNGDWQTLSTKTLQATEGTHTYSVSVEDVAGNTFMQNLTMTLDTEVIAPDLYLLSDTGQGSLDKVTNLSEIYVYRLESGAIWSYQIDGGSWITGGTADQGTGIFNAITGEHTYKVRQIDSAGNSAISVNNIAVILDTTPPEIVSKSTVIKADENILISFDTSNDQLYFSGGNFTLSGPNGDFRTIVLSDTSQVSISLNKEYLTINPTNDLGAGTYVASLDGRSVTDHAGNRIPGFLTWDISVL